MRTAIKLDLSPGLDHALWGILVYKTNATSHPNIGLFKFAIEEEWNQMSEDSIFKAYKSLERRLDIIVLKRVTILSKFTVF